MKVNRLVILWANTSHGVATDSADAFAIAHRYLVKRAETKPLNLAWDSQSTLPETGFQNHEKKIIAKKYKRYPGRISPHKKEKKGVTVSVLFEKKNQERHWKDILQVLEVMQKAKKAQVMVRELYINKKQLDVDKNVWADIKKFLGKDDNCGMYIIMHGGGGEISPTSAREALSSEALATVLNELVLEGSKCFLRKINLVACTLGSQASKEAPSYAQKFCEKLQNKGTMVAAYTVPVYVARQNNDELKGELGVADMQVPEDLEMGQKIVQPETNHFAATKLCNVEMDPGNIKKVFRWNGQGVEEVSLGEYSDSGKYT